MEPSENNEINYKETVLTACSLLIVVPVIIYVANFHGGFGSQTEFGAFGDFINPFLTSVNIVLLIYLTLYIKKSDDNKNERNIRFQKELNLLNLKYEAYQKISQELDVFDTLDYYIDEKEAQKLYRRFFYHNNFLFTNYEFLFKDLDWDEISSQIIQIHTALGDTLHRISYYYNAPFSFDKIEGHHYEFTQNFNKFFSLKRELKEKFQKSIV